MSRLSFDAPRTGTGTAEWAERTENIQRGCSNGCLYCYAAHNANRFKLRARADWEREELTKKAEMTSYPRRDGVVMFPSAHDITPGNIDAYLRVAKLILAAGNRLLIVSKPRLECIRRVVAELAAYHPQVMFRFTIGTMDPDVASFWEPGAPAPQERVEALRLGFEAGFRTSVSAEPLLGSVETAVDVLAAVRPYVTDTVWIGKLNKARQRVDLTIQRNSAEVERIEAQQSDVEVVRLYERLAGDPMVRWKDSIVEVLAKAGRALEPSGGDLTCAT